MNTMAKPVSAGKSASRSLKTSSPPAEAPTPTTGMTALAGPSCSGASAVKARSPSASVSGWIPPGISFSSMMVPFSLWLWQSKGYSMPRYRQRGRPPCLPLWKLLSPDDVDRDFRGDVAVEPHRHLELAELFNRFVQLNLPAIDGEVQRPERAGIHSGQNARVKELRRAFGEAAPNAEGEVAVEGMHIVEEAIRSGLRLATVFFSESAKERAHKLLPQLSSHTEALLLPDEVFASAVPSETPQGVAALVHVKSFALDEMFVPAPALLVAIAGLQDPGNLGTIARSAEAFEVTGLLLGERTVSPWNWKAVRASAGSLFRLPALKIELATALREMKARGVRVLTTSSHKGTAITEVDLRAPVAFIVGGEGAGVPKDVLAQADEVVAIPHSSKVDSRNAGIAASILLYEAARQRKSQ